MPKSPAPSSNICSSVRGGTDSAWAAGGAAEETVRVTVSCLASLSLSIPRPLEACQQHSGDGVLFTAARVSLRTGSGGVAGGEPTPTWGGVAVVKHYNCAIKEGGESPFIDKAWRA